MKLWAIVLFVLGSAAWAQTGPSHLESAISTAPDGAVIYADFYSPPIKQIEVGLQPGISITIVGGLYQPNQDGIGLAITGDGLGSGNHVTLIGARVMPATVGYSVPLLVGGLDSMTIESCWIQSRPSDGVHSSPAVFSYDTPLLVTGSWIKGANGGQTTDWLSPIPMGAAAIESGGSVRVLHSVIRGGNGPRILASASLALTTDTGTGGPGVLCRRISCFDSDVVPGLGAQWDQGYFGPTGQRFIELNPLEVARRQ